MSASPLLGRSEGLRRALGALAAGRSVLLRGVDGVGRTAVVETLATSLRRRRLVVDVVGSEGEDPMSDETLSDGRRRIVVIDDAHLHREEHLARVLVPERRALVSVSTGSGLSSVVTSWVRSADVDVVDLDSLPPELTAELAECLVGRPASRGAAATLHHISGGLPLYLLDLVCNALDSGGIDAERRHIAFVREPEFSPNVQMRLDSMLESFPTQLRDSMEVLAFCGSVPESIAVSLVGLDALTDLECRHHIAAGANGVALVHRPLAHHVASGLGRLQRRQLLCGLTERLSGIGGIEWEAFDLMNRAMSGESVSTTEYLESAQRQLDAGNTRRADEILWLLPDEQRTQESEVLNGTIATALGALHRAEGAFREAKAMTGSQASARAMLGLARVAFASNRYAEANAHLDSALELQVDDAVSSEASSARLEFSLFDRRWDDVVEDAARLAEESDDRHLRDTGRVFGALARCFVGPASEALDMLPASPTDVAPGVEPWYRFARFSAGVIGGELQEVMQWSRDDRECAESGAAGPYAGMYLGITAAALSWAGDITGSIAVLHEAQAALDREDAAGFRSILLPFASYVHGFAGDREEAQRLLAVFERTETRPLAVGNGLRARLWVEALGRHEREVRKIAEQLNTAGAITPGWSVIGLHDLARLGYAALVDLESLERAAMKIGGPFAAAVVDHVTGLVRDDVDITARAAGVFGQLGYQLHAAEAWANVEHVCTQGELGVRARRLRAINEAACRGAHTPPLSSRDEILTRREEQVALLAADGLTNRAIGRQLVISVRTVENHLQHIFSKLDISNRKALPSALAAASERRRPATSRRAQDG